MTEVIDKSQLQDVWEEQIGHNLEVQDFWYGFAVRPGFYLQNGAVAMPKGVSFTVHSQGAKAVDLLLFHQGAEEPYAIIPFPERYKVGDVYSMLVFGLDIRDLEYAFRLDGPWREDKGLLFDKSKAVIDPYARKFIVQRGNAQYPYRASVTVDDYDWGDSVSPALAQDEMIIYELHVKGFTQNPNSGVTHRGTFKGLEEKIPYLKELGVNVIELMPIFAFDPMIDPREVNGQVLGDYWGYNPAAFFSYHTPYAADESLQSEGKELKDLVKALHDNGMEVILDVVFNHTAEGNHDGPHISFKGFDNNVYYMLTPDANYFNFSGCGNTLNANNPVVRQFIIECLRYWVSTYHIDGFRFDLASILGRNADGSPMSHPPLLESLAYDPILKKAELIAEAWDAGGLYQVGSFPSWNRWLEWNGRYRDDLRCFLKGDYNMSAIAAERVMGSRDLYPIDKRGKYASVNFITCHDGFPLRDLYSYNEKHNAANGWNNTDGDSHNNSWNCGVEGDTDDPEILALRQKLMLNAIVVLLCSHGIPMLLAGDEFQNTQFGNNNPYCQDNNISWLDWSLLEKHKEHFDFCKKMIRFRKQHPILRGSAKPPTLALVERSVHGLKAWQMDANQDAHYFALMFAGKDSTEQRDEVIFLAVNAHWEDKEVELPRMPHDEVWHRVINTAEGFGQNFYEDVLDAPRCINKLQMPARSVSVLISYPETSWDKAIKSQARMEKEQVAKAEGLKKRYRYHLDALMQSGKSIKWLKSETMTDTLEKEKK